MHYEAWRDFFFYESPEIFDTLGLGLLNFFISSIIINNSKILKIKLSIMSTKSLSIGVKNLQKEISNKISYNNKK